MTQHRIARANLDESLREIVRGGEHIDSLYLDGDEWVVITEERLETRTHAARLGVKP